MSARLHCIGFGGQGSVWANCLRKAGWEVLVYLPKGGSSSQKAQKQHFPVYPLESLSAHLSEEPHGFPLHPVAMLCPDFMIGKVYREYLASVKNDLTLVLAHGYAVYADDLKLASPQHERVLFAPKVIGPYLEEEFLKKYPHSHDFKAAVCLEAEASVKTQSFLKVLSSSLGFREENLISTTFEMETIADLISEQGLLCGSFFPFLSWTIQAMKEAGVPEDLIREECFTELQFITAVLQRLGPEETFQKISAAAKAGTVFMKERLEKIGAREELQLQVQEILNKKFVEKLQKEDWIEKVNAFRRELQQ